jgi:hypothetical protein
MPRKKRKAVVPVAVTPPAVIPPTARQVTIKFTGPTKDGGQGEVTVSGPANAPETWFQPEQPPEPGVKK